MRKILVRILLIAIMVISGVKILPSQSVQATDCNKSTYYVETNEDELIAIQRALANHEENFTIRYLASNEEDLDYMAADICDMRYDYDGIYWDEKLYANASYGLLNWGTVDWKDTSVIVKGHEWKNMDYKYYYQSSYKEYQELYKAVRRLIIDSGIATKSDYEKVAWVYNWMCDNIKYDYTYKVRTAYDTLENKKAVCEGYALLFEVFAGELGLNTRYVEGNAVSSESLGLHAWNLVELDGRWYHVDTTWGVGDRGSNFLKGSIAFDTRHRLDEITLNSKLNCNISATDFIINTQYSGVPARLYNINLDPVYMERLNIGEEYNWLISNDTCIKLNYENSNPEIVNLTADGKVTALKAGKSTLVATNTELGIKQSIEITVSKEKATVGNTTTIKSANNVSVIYGKTAQIKLHLHDKDSKLQGVKYTSKDNAIAIVDKNGRVTGKKVGTTNITITCDNGSKTTIKVTVKPLINTTAVTVKVNGKVSLQDAIVMSKNGYKDLKFIVSSNSKTSSIMSIDGTVKSLKTILTVSSDGIVVGKSKGTATVEIYNKSINKLLGTVKVTVK